MSGRDGLIRDFSEGVTTVCRAWSVLRADGVGFGFTDHDSDLVFEAVTFKASSGLTARALQQTTGLAVDNSEAIGALTSASVTEADLAAGRFDGAEVRSWLVNWADVDQRIEQFRGNFGEIQRSSGTFRVELRGLTERLNLPQGRAFQSGCSAVLGDGHCGFDLSQPGYREEVALAGLGPEGQVLVEGLTAQAAGWFERGRLTVLSGAAAGLFGMVKVDRFTGSGRSLHLWHGLGAPLAEGDLLRLEAGCDRRAETCRTKFANFLNYRGFPHVPGEDWLSSYPVSSKVNDGGSLGR